MLHALAGLPRSGSTVLGACLSQHPNVYVSPTSALARAVEAVQGVLTNESEIQSDLATIPGSHDRYLNVYRALSDAWHDRPERVVIDKGRGWVQYPDLLAALGGHLIVCVRDPRDVIASIDRNHRATPQYASIIAPTLYESAENLMQPTSLVGGPIRFIEDLVRRGCSNVTFIRYESFVLDPRTYLDRIIEAIGEEPFIGWDLDNITSQSPDLDALYRDKYPHTVTATIKPPAHTWRDAIDPQLAELIASRYPFYMHTFGYVQG